MALLVDESVADTSSRLSAIRLCMFTLRAMENWRDLVDDCEKAMILVAVCTINGERFTRDEELDDELRDVRVAFPQERLRLCNISSIAAATGFNRETTRRKVKELIEAGRLMRSSRGILRFRPGALPGDEAHALIRKQLDVVVRLTNDLMRDGVIARD